MEIERKDIENIMLQRYGADVYEKITNASVAVCGLGGLGSNIAVSLARCGVGRMLLIDYDRVDLSNINRQQYSLEHIGLYKTDAIRRIIESINPYLDIEYKNIKLTAENAVNILSGFKIVCEAFDNAEEKATLVNTLLEKTNAIVIAGSGMAGYSTANSIRTKKVFDRLYICGDRSSELSDTNFLAAPRVAVCANHQANMALRLILDRNEV